MRFSVKHLTSGGVVAEFFLPAREAGVVGVYRAGVPYQPRVDAETVNAAPYHIRRAMLRAAPLGFGSHSSDGADVVRMDLTRAKDSAPMGTLFASLVI